MNTWTKELPTKEGMYWYCEDNPVCIPKIRKVEISDKDIAQVYRGYPEWEPYLLGKEMEGYWQYIPLPSHPSSGHVVSPDLLRILSHYKT